MTPSPKLPPGPLVDPTLCWCCKAPDPRHVVAEVWFDMGKPGVRLGSTEHFKGPKPAMCDLCYEKDENKLAQAVFRQMQQSGAFGPLTPSRWWVRYEGEASFGQPGFKPLGGPIAISADGTLAS